MLRQEVITGLEKVECSSQSRRRHRSLLLRDESSDSEKGYFLSSKFTFFADQVPCIVLGPILPDLDVSTKWVLGRHSKGIPGQTIPVGCGLFSASGWLMWVNIAIEAS